DVTDDLTIDGPGAQKLTVSGSTASRVFAVSGATTDVLIDNLTVANGSATGTTFAGPVSPVTAGGGILDNGARLTLSQVNWTDNQAAGVLAAGGGVASVFGATLAVDASTFTGNRVAGTSVDSPGGAIFTDAGSTLTVSRSLFTGNRAIDGGAVAVWGGSSASV